MFCLFPGLLLFSQCNLKVVWFRLSTCLKSPSRRWAGPGGWRKATLQEVSSPCVESPEEPSQLIPALLFSRGAFRMEGGGRFSFRVLTPSTIKGSPPFPIWYYLMTTNFRQSTLNFFLKITPSPRLKKNLDPSLVFLFLFSQKLNVEDLDAILKSMK